MMVAVVICLSRARPMDEAATSDRLHDLGNLMLAFTMLWAYMSFAQYLIIWAGNLPEEIPWYLRRTRGGWQWVALGLALFHFFLPFFVLLFRETKRQSRLLVAGGLSGPGDALARPGLAGRPGLVRPGQPAIPLGRAADEPGGAARDRGRLRGGLHRAVEEHALDPAQRPEPERGHRARRRVTTWKTHYHKGCRYPERVPGMRATRIGLRGIVIFTVALVGTVVLVQVVLGLVMGGSRTRRNRLDALASRPARDRGRPVPEPPAPAEVPRTTWLEMKDEEKHRITSYGWVDRKAGIARIPVDRAMDILAEIGPAQGRRAGARPGGASEHVHPAGDQAGRTAARTEAG